MPRGTGGILDIPQHGADKSNHAQNSHLDPDLQIKIVGMDKGRFAVIEIEAPNIGLRSGSTQSRAGDGRAANYRQRRRIRFSTVVGRNGTASTHSTMNAGISFGFQRNTNTAMVQASPTQLARE